MTIELYHTAHSTCSQKVRIALAEKGKGERNKDWVEREVDLGRFPAARAGISQAQSQRRGADLRA